MARPTKATVDYFPHDTERGKTLFILENTWGNDGYAAWFKILERLGSSKNHVINMNDLGEAAYTAAYCKVSQEILYAILDQCSALNAINPGLWRKKLIYSQNFVNNVADAYRKRQEQLPSIDTIKTLYFELFTEETQFPAEEIPISDEFPAEETGKGKGKGKLKGKERKESNKEITLSLIPPDFQISDRVKKWAAGQKRNHLEDHLESFKLKCQAKKYKYADWDAAFMNAIRDDWARLGENGNGNGNGSGSYGGAGKVTQKTGGARSDDQPYPVDAEY